MTTPRFLKGQLNWWMGGIALTFSFVLAVALVKPIGVSTQYVIFDGLLLSTIDDGVVKPDTKTKSGYTSSNEYLAKSGGKYAKAIENPLNYSFVFVLSMIAGAFLSSKMAGPKVNGSERVAPTVWQQRFGNSPYLRYGISFLGGVLALYGARLAGGCTSGHMMSGMMQTSVSGYLFAAGVFATAIPTAIIFYRKA